MSSQSTPPPVAPFLARIFLYPIKSLPPVEVPAAKVMPSGALQHDRQFALVDADGQFVNAKRAPRVHRLRAVIEPAQRTVSLQDADAGEPSAFHLDADRQPLESWLSDFFGTAVRLLENAETGFPDDLDAPGPTIVSTATLEQVASWFPGLSLDDVRLRFRANLELANCPAFWEDRLYGDLGTARPFHLGDVALSGVNPCARCAVPTRSPLTGEAMPSFARRFSERRQAELPAWAAVSRFDHFYRLAVNTRLGAGHPSSGTLRVGNRIQLG